MQTDRELIDEIRANARPIFEHFLGNLPYVREAPTLCPFHDDSNASMGVNCEKGMFNCLSCGASGDVITFVKRLEDTNFPTALRLCADLAGIDRHVTVKNDPSVVLKREQRQEEAELLSALRAWHGRTAMLKAAKAYDLDRELYKAREKASRISEARKREQSAAFRVFEERLRALPGLFVQAEEEADDYLAADKDLLAMARLFVRENGVKLSTATTVRDMSDAIQRIWEASLGDSIEPGRRPRLDELLALSLLRKVPNATLLEHLGRGWYVDVLLSGHTEAGSVLRSDAHGSLFDDGGEDRPAQDRGGALEGPRVGDRAFAEAARAAVERAREFRSEVKAAGERIAEHWRAVLDGSMDVG